MKQKKETGFRKYDQGKPRYELMPSKAFQQVVEVLTYGASKYTAKDSDGADNWKKCPEPNKRYYSACLRHLEAHRQGEILDKETNKPHLAHAICCLLFMLEHYNMNNK